MDSDIQAILGSLREFNKTYESVADELRLSLIAIILRHMKTQKLSQKDLAARAGVADSFLSRVLNDDNNPTIDTFANLLHALGRRGRVEELSEEPGQYLEASESNATYEYSTEESSDKKVFKVTSVQAKYTIRASGSAALKGVQG